MKKGIFVLYCSKGLKIPKIYKYNAYVQKAIIKQPTYQIQICQDQGEGKQILQAKQQQYKNTLLTAKVNYLKASLESTVFNQQNQLQTSKLIDQKIRESREKQVNQIFATYGFNLSSQFKSETIQASPVVQYQGYFDGASKGNPGPASAGFLIRHYHNILLARTQALGKLTCNQAQMMGVGLLMAHAYCNDIQNFIVFGDSKLTIEFMKGINTARDQKMITLLKANQILSNKFKLIKFNHIRRALNQQANQLAANAFQKKKKT